MTYTKKKKKYIIYIHPKSHTKTVGLKIASHILVRDTGGDCAVNLIDNLHVLNGRDVWVIMI